MYITSISIFFVLIVNIFSICSQVKHHPQPGVYAEKEGVCGAGSKLLDSKETGEERSTPHQTTTVQPTVPSEDPCCTAGQSDSCPPVSDTILIPWLVHSIPSHTPIIRYPSRYYHSSVKENRPKLPRGIWLYKWELHCSPCLITIPLFSNTNVGDIIF
jgi:hypothetical protein